MFQVTCFNKDTKIEEEFYKKEIRVFLFPLQLHVISRRIVVQQNN